MCGPDSADARTGVPHAARSVEPARLPLAVTRQHRRKPVAHPSVTSSIVWSTAQALRRLGLHGSGLHVQQGARPPLPRGLRSNGARRHAVARSVSGAAHAIRVALDDARLELVGRRVRHEHVRMTPFDLTPAPAAAHHVHHGLPEIAALRRRRHHRRIFPYPRRERLAHRVFGAASDRLRAARRAAAIRRSDRRRSRRTSGRPAGRKSLPARPRSTRPPCCTDAPDDRKVAEPAEILVAATTSRKSVSRSVQMKRPAQVGCVQVGQSGPHATGRFIAVAGI